MKSRTHSSYDEATALEEIHERGWTDGLPVVVPTPSRVAAMLAGGGIDLFRNEHQKLLRYVTGIRKSFETLRPRETGGSTRIIELLDFEAKFKNLLKHHDLRERIDEPGEATG